MAYTLPKIDFDKKMEKIEELRKERLKNGEEPVLDLTEEDFNDSMTVEEAWSYYNDRGYRHDAQMTEERMDQLELDSYIRGVIKGRRNLYLLAEETLKKAGEL